MAVRAAARRCAPRFPRGSPTRESLKESAPKVPPRLPPISQLFKLPQKWCCSGNVKYHRFPCLKSRFVSQWPENPTICHDIEMAWGLVVCSMTLCRWRAPETSLSPISQLFKSPQKWCCPGNVEYHRFPCSKSRFVSQWPENPTICHDIEMAWGLVVCSMTLWQWRALETSLYPIFQNQNFRC